jgi:hypothetical protein
VRVRQAEPLDPELLESKLRLQDDRGMREVPAAVAGREQVRTALTTLPEEQRQLAVLGEIAPAPARRRATFRRLAVVGAVAAVVAITAGGMLLGFRDDRRLAAHYRATLAQAHGTYFGAVRLTDPAGRQVGVVFAYRAPRPGSSSPSHPGTVPRSSAPSSSPATAARSRSPPSG